MLRQWLAALRGGTEQLRYRRHAYSPFSPWRRQIDAVIDGTRRELERYGIAADVDVDRRRAYQVARMVVADEQGRHLAQLLPDAYLAYSPPSAATFHDGKRRYPAPHERLASFRRHPQTLAYLTTPPRLARKGLGASAQGGLGVVAAGEQLDETDIQARLQGLVAGAPAAETARWARVLATLGRGVASQDDAAAS